MEHKRLLIATILFVIFLVFWQMFFFKQPPTQPQQAGQKGQVDSSNAELQASGIPEIDTISQNPIIVKTPLYTAKFSANGVLLDYYIPKYDVHLLPEGGFAFSTPFDSLFERPPIETLYVSDVDFSLEFIGITPDSAETLVKSFKFKPESYLIEFKGPNILSFSSLNFTEQNLKDELRYTGLISYRTKYQKLSIKKIRPKFQLDGEELIWAGFRTKYFMMAVIPLENTQIDDIYITETDKNKFKLDFVFKSPNPEMQVYFGPIDYYRLKEVGYALWRVFDFGPAIVRPFGKIILSIIRFLYRYIHNYGWVIVIFAVLMKFVLFPVNLKNLKNMQKMRELKPQLDAIKKRFKDDPERMQREMMELYRKHGFNPFSGCLILLFQLPIFWAMYQILRTYIDLRGAHWILWIKDLSSRDPYFILPILMGITSLAQSLMQPMQDEQSKIMAIMMPLIFTFIFLTFPSGIVLYWLTFNLLGVAEQIVLRRWKQ